MPEYKVYSNSGQMPFSKAVCYDSLLYTSGMIGIDQETKVVPDAFADQAHLLFKNINELLKTSGTTYDHVIKVNIYLTDMSDYAELNRIYREYFINSDTLPVRTCISVKSLPHAKAKVEIDLIARLENEN